MKIKISQMSAYALAEYTMLDKEIIEQINNAPAKSDILYLNAPIEVLQKALSELKEFMKSNTEYNSEAFIQILNEVEYLANQNT